MITVAPGPHRHPSFPAGTLNRSAPCHPVGTLDNREYEHDIADSAAATGQIPDRAEHDRPHATAPPIAEKIGRTADEFPRSAKRC